MFVQYQPVYTIVEYLTLISPSPMTLTADTLCPSPPAHNVYQTARCLSAACAAAGHRGGRVHLPLPHLLITHQQSLGGGRRARVTAANWRRLTGGHTSADGWRAGESHWSRDRRRAALTRFSLSAASAVPCRDPSRAQTPSVDFGRCPDTDPSRPDFSTRLGVGLGSVSLSLSEVAVSVTPLQSSTPTCRFGSSLSQRDNMSIPKVALRRAVLALVTLCAALHFTSALERDFW